MVCLLSKTQSHITYLLMRTNLYVINIGLPAEEGLHCHSRTTGAHNWRLLEDGDGEPVQLYSHALYTQGGGRGINRSCDCCACASYTQKNRIISECMNFVLTFEG